VRADGEEHTYHNAERSCVRDLGMRKSSLRRARWLHELYSNSRELPFSHLHFQPALLEATLSILDAYLLHCPMDFPLFW
jgi:hypothetical protein